ncbi:MAG: PadR family transcriptional regulator [Chloroflexi bacterium]|nr:PadR family transcriptional regulator [Chloroflexota bacterium]
MSLSYALLSILNILPMTGYDLKHQAFDQTVRYYWPADQSQIYRTLKRLTEKGMLTATVEDSDQGPDRKVYHVTEKGRQALADWQRTDQQPPTIRDPFLIQMSFGSELTNDELHSLIAHQLEVHRAQLAEYQAIPIPPREAFPQNRWLALQHLTLDLGRRIERAYVEWLQMCLDADLPAPEGQEPRLLDNPDN